MSSLDVHGRNLYFSRWLFATTPSREWVSKSMRRKTCVCVVSQTTASGCVRITTTRAWETNTTALGSASGLGAHVHVVRTCVRCANVFARIILANRRARRLVCKAGESARDGWVCVCVLAMNPAADSVKDAKPGNGGGGKWMHLISDKAHTAQCHQDTHTTRSPLPLHSICCCVALENAQKDLSIMRRWAIITILRGIRSNMGSTFFAASKFVVKFLKVVITFL